MLTAVQHCSYHIKQNLCFTTFTRLTGQHSCFSDDELLSQGSDVWLLWACPPSPSFSCAASLCILLAKFCRSSVFVLAWPQFSPSTIVQWLPGLDMHRAAQAGHRMIWKWEVWMRIAAYVLTGALLFAQSSSTHWTSLALSPEIFLLSFLWDRMDWIWNTCSDHGDTIEFDTILDLVKDKQTRLCLFVLSTFVNVSWLALGAELQGGRAQTILCCF